MMGVIEFLGSMRILCGHTCMPSLTVTAMKGAALCCPGDL